MAAHPLEIPRESALLARLAAGTAGVVGKEFLRRLVTELAAALDVEMAFVAELCGEGDACTIASAGKPGIELREGTVFTLAGTPCEHAYHARHLPRQARRPPALPAGPVPARSTSSTATSRSRCATLVAARSATSA